jgi:hypothetical protein
MTMAMYLLPSPLGAILWHGALYAEVVKNVNVNSWGEPARTLRTVDITRYDNLRLSMLLRFHPNIFIVRAFSQLPFCMLGFVDC